MADVTTVAPFQGRLQVDSTSQVSLQRYAGAFVPLKIGGTWRAAIIPSSAPTLSNSGLTAATLYYVYVYDNSGTMTLEASATGWAADTTSGVPIKSGTDTRTLCGMVYMDAGTPGTFVDSAIKRWCLNYYHRRTLDLASTFSSDRTTSSTTFVEANSEIRVQFLAWADEACLFGASGDASNDAGATCGNGIGIDSTSTALATATTSAPVNNRALIGLQAPTTLAEGFHYATLLSEVSSGTGKWYSADNVGNGSGKVRFWGGVQG